MTSYVNPGQESDIYCKSTLPLLWQQLRCRCPGLSGHMYQDNPKDNTHQFPSFH